MIADACNLRKKAKELLFASGRFFMIEFKTKPASQRDAAGASLLPGLIDSHVHVDDPAQAAILAHWGVTTALDMAAKNLCVIAGLKGTAGSTDLRSAGSPAGPHDGTHMGRIISDACGGSPGGRAYRHCHGRRGRGPCRVP